MSHWTDPLRYVACSTGLREGRQSATFSGWWEKSVRSDYMLWLLEKVGYSDDRKLRLLACRFVRDTRADDSRTVWDLLKYARLRHVVEVAEQYATGQAMKGELATAWSAACAAWAAVDAAWDASEEAAVDAALDSGLDSGLDAAVEAGWNAVRVARVLEESLGGGGRVAGRVSAVALAFNQQANIIRAMISSTEIVWLFERYIDSLTEKDHPNNQDDDCRD